MARTNLTIEIDAKVLVKGDERYILIYPPSKQKQALRQLGRWAVNEELSFTWYDATLMSRAVLKGANDV